MDPCLLLGSAADFVSGQRILRTLEAASLSFSLPRRRHQVDSIFRGRFQLFGEHSMHESDGNRSFTHS
jgi:hypothetical protein